jgi:hypothetical protein
VRKHDALRHRSLSCRMYCELRTASELMPRYSDCWCSREKATRILRNHLRLQSGTSVVILVGALTLAGCTFDEILLTDAVPLPAHAVPLPRPAPKFSAAAPALPTWRHLPEPVSAEQLNQDKATCAKVGHSSPGLGSPELKFYLAFTNCMRSGGYEAISSL